MDDLRKDTAIAPPGPPEIDQSSGMVPIQGNPTAAAMDQIGVTGLKAYSGYINEEYLPELVGTKAIKVYRTMADDPIVNAVLTAITLILRAVDWRVEPADNGKDGGKFSAQAEAEAEFAQSLLDDMSHPWEDTIGEALSMLQFGWSYLEIVLKKRVGPDEQDPAKRSKFDDGRIGVRKLPIRAQDSLFRWDLQEDGGCNGLWQQSPQGGQQLYIPIERALLFRTTSRKNSPEGVSILRAAYRPWYIKRGIEDHEAIGIERELAGLPVVSIPKKYLAPTATGNDLMFRNVAEKLARDIKMNSQAGVVLPSETFLNPDGSWSSIPMMKLELLSAGGARRMIDTDPVVKRHNRLIAMSALADFLTLGDDKGSYALSANKSELFLRACEAYLNQIASVINRFLFPRIFAYNGIDHTLIPQIKPGRLAPVDLNELGAYITAMAGAGAPLFPNQELSNYLADVAGMPEPPEDIGLMAKPGTMPGPGQIDPLTGKPIQPKIDPESGRPQHEVDRQDAVDELAASSFETNASTPARKYNHGHDDHGRFATATGADSDHGVAPAKLSDDEWSRILSESKDRSATAKQHVDDVLSSKNNMAIYTDPDRPKRQLVISRSLDSRYGLRATDFDEKGPIGHREYTAGDRRGIHTEISHALAGDMQRTSLKFDKYNERHDERGRFDFGGGTGGLAKGLYDKTLEHGVTPQDIFNRVSPDAQSAATSLEASMATRAYSDKPEAEGGYLRADGTYTPERQALHQALVDKIFTDDAVAGATPANGERPLMTMLGGRGGSGKSFLTGPDGPVDAAHTIVLNSDDFKEPLAKASGLDQRYAALYHEESDHVLKMASARAKAQGLNVAFDSTMKTHATAAARALEYQAAGYDLAGHYVHTAPQEAAARSIQRFYKNGAANGRYVPPAIILGNTQNEANFDKLSPQFKSWTIWDNNGSAPKLVAKGGK